MTLPEALALEQGSPEWLEARVGVITASRAGDVIAMKKRGDGEKQERANYRAELICERLTGQPYPHYVSIEMQWGLDQEPFARAAYELQRGLIVDTVGFVLHPGIPGFGCSPDGFVGDDGLIQIKCPTTATHINWLRAGTVPVEHCPQMLAEMSCTGRIWCDFVSFDPRLPDHLQLFVVRYHRDEQFIRSMEREVVHFRGEIESVLASLPEKPSKIAEVLDWPNTEEMEF
jgi:YqaJ-like viral recombinase domain